MNNEVCRYTYKFYVVYFHMYPLCDSLHSEVVSPFENESRLPDLDLAYFVTSTMTNMDILLFKFITPGFLPLDFKQVKMTCGKNPISHRSKLHDENFLSAIFLRGLPCATLAF